MSVVALWLPNYCWFPPLLSVVALLSSLLNCRLLWPRLYNSDMSQQKNKRQKIALNYPPCAISKGNNDGKTLLKWMKNRVLNKQEKVKNMTLVWKDRLIVGEFFHLSQLWFFSFIGWGFLFQFSVEYRQLLHLFLLQFVEKTWFPYDWTLLMVNFILTVVYPIKSFQIPNT